MKSGFYLRKHHSAGNLHIFLFGEFNGMCAWELLKTLRREGADAGRVFVDTDGLGSVSTSGVSLFKSHMIQKRLSKDWLYFKGKKGFQIAPDGSRVLIINKSGNRERLHPTTTSANWICRSNKEIIKTIIYKEK